MILSYICQIIKTFFIVLKVIYNRFLLLAANEKDVKANIIYFGKWKNTERQCHK